MAVPRISVVIPAYARPQRLAACLQALAASDFPKADFEVVVVDDGSPEPLAPHVEQYRPALALTVLRQANAGPAAARNAGAAAASGALLAFTDDDCLPEPGWIGALAAALEQAPDALAGGAVLNALPGNIFATASQELVDFLYEWFGAEAGEAPFFTSNNIGCHRDRFLALGGFDESFPLAAAEDREFGLRWRARGGRLRFAPGARVGHAHKLDLAGFWRQHRNYGRGARHLHRVLAAGGDAQPRREPLGFYAALMLHPVRTAGLGALPRSALMVLSQFAMVAGYRAESRHPAPPRAKLINKEAA